MILLGFGAGLAFNPLLLAAMSDVEPSESGLASGIVNTSFMMGGALGLAVLASLAASRTDTLRAEGAAELGALTGGYHLAFVVGAVFAAAAAVIGGLLRAGQTAGAHDEARRAAPATEFSSVMGKVIAEISMSLGGYVAGHPSLEMPLGEGGEQRTSSSPLEQVRVGLVGPLDEQLLACQSRSVKSCGPSGSRDLAFLACVVLAESRSLSEWRTGRGLLGKLLGETVPCTGNGSTKPRTASCSAGIAPRRSPVRVRLAPPSKALETGPFRLKRGRRKSGRCPVLATTLPRRRQKPSSRLTVRGRYQL